MQLSITNGTIQVPVLKFDPITLIHKIDRKRAVALHPQNLPINVEIFLSIAVGQN
jgi:hypothetical protein